MSVRNNANLAILSSISFRCLNLCNIEVAMKVIWYSGNLWRTPLWDKQSENQNQPFIFPGYEVNHCAHILDICVMQWGYCNVSVDMSQVALAVGITDTSSGISHLCLVHGDPAKYAVNPNDMSSSCVSAPTASHYSALTASNLAAHTLYFVDGDNFTISFASLSDLSTEQRITVTPDNSEVHVFSFSFC